MTSSLRSRRRSGCCTCFVVIEHGTRRLAHVNVTAHPSADWTLQQLREVVGEEGGPTHLIHDRDRIFAKHLDDSIRALGLKVLRSPIASPKANSICERVIGTIRRECLDWMIPMSEAHLRVILKEWVCPLQPRTSSQRAGSWRTGSAARSCGSSEVRIPTSIGGGCARAREIGPGRLASRVFDCDDECGCVIARQGQGGKRDGANKCGAHWAVCRDQVHGSLALGAVIRRWTLTTRRTAGRSPSRRGRR